MEWKVCDIHDISSLDYQKYVLLMTERKRQRILRFRNVEDKMRSIAAEMLARHMIAKRCLVPEESITFDTKKSGKPFARGLPVEYSVSHSGRLIACAVDELPVGIDLERIRPVDLTTAKYFCTEKELVYLFQHVPVESDFSQNADPAVLTRFFKLWASKEACCKFAGSGISDLNVMKEHSIEEATIWEIQKEYILALVNAK